MQYKDYYSALGIARDASTSEIKTAYRKLARKYHPDVSKEPDAEKQFKDIAEAYQTLKDPDKRTAYDQLGRPQPGQEFKPPPDWQQQYGETQFSFEDMDLSDLFAGFGGKRPHPGRQTDGMPIPGQDYEVSVPITLEQAFHGTEIDLDLNVPEYDAQGVAHRRPHPVKARIPKGATDGQRLRVPGKGGQGSNGGRQGDLYLNITLHTHGLFRATGHDLYLDLPLAPWEAVLGTTVEVPTPGGPIRLKVPAGTQAGQQLRLSKRGLPKPRGGEGDILAIVRITVPKKSTEEERMLFQQLADRSRFNPRQHFKREASHES